MAFDAKDGKKFSMASRRNAHDSASGIKASRESALGTQSATAPPQEQSVDSGATDDGMDQSQGDTAPEQVAEQHGPATQVTVQHDPETDSHTVTSVHPDGHEEMSQHGSAEEAHEHAAKLAGGHKKKESPAHDDDDSYESDDEY